MSSCCCSTKDCNNSLYADEGTQYQLLSLLVFRGVSPGCRLFGTALLLWGWRLQYQTLQLLRIMVSTFIALWRPRIWAFLEAYSLSKIQPDGKKGATDMFLIQLHQYDVYVLFHISTSVRIDKQISALNVTKWHLGRSVLERFPGQMTLALTVHLDEGYDTSVVFIRKICRLGDYNVVCGKNGRSGLCYKWQ